VSVQLQSPRLSLDGQDEVKHGFYVHVPLFYCSNTTRLLVHISRVVNLNSRIPTERHRVSS